MFKASDFKDKDGNPASPEAAAEIANKKFDRFKKLTAEISRPCEIHNVEACRSCHSYISGSERLNAQAN